MRIGMVSLKIWQGLTVIVLILDKGMLNMWYNTNKILFYYQNERCFCKIPSVVLSKLRKLDILSGLLRSTCNWGAGGGDNFLDQLSHIVGHLDQLIVKCSQASWFEDIYGHTFTSTQLFQEVKISLESPMTYMSCLKNTNQ